ncbi:hypothetical protein OG21DRAFT_544713 [Imleria badia]|nr:hypothetical protein OG21DRAFT_544713 [Imleria badia]
MSLSATAEVCHLSLWRYTYHDVLGSRDMCEKSIPTAIPSRKAEYIVDMHLFIWGIMHLTFNTQYFPADQRSFALTFMISVTRLKHERKRCSESETLRLQYEKDTYTAYRHLNPTLAWRGVHFKGTQIHLRVNNTINKIVPPSGRYTHWHDGQRRSPRRRQYWLDCWP